MTLLKQGAMVPLAQSPPQQPEADQRSSLFSPRSRRQLGFFFAGAGFFALSTLVTRRALVRRYRSTLPKFYQPSNRPDVQVNGAMEAFEALNIATINVLSLAMMTAGGLLYAFDISSVDDVRRSVRARLGWDGAPADRDEEEQAEEFLASILDRRDKRVKEVKEENGK